MRRHDDELSLHRPPRGPGDGEDEELPIGDPPDDDDTDDPDDDDEGEEEDVPLHGVARTAAMLLAARQLQPRSR